MPLPETAFTNPYWIKIPYGATLERDDRHLFDCMELQYNNQPNRHWRMRPRPGYNTQSPVVFVETVNLSVDTPYIRAR